MDNWNHLTSVRRSEFRRLEKELDVLDGVHEGISSQIRQLYKELHQKDQQIEQLQWMLDTLLTTLDQTGLVNARSMAEGWKAYEKKQKEAQKNEVPDTRCGRCAKTVPVNQTYFSALGEVCHPCFEVLQLEDDEDDLTF